MGYESMARGGASNRAYLEQHRGKWRVTVAVPKALQPRLGTRLKRALNTDSLSVANSVKLGVVQELKDQIARAQGRSNTEYGSVINEAARIKSAAVHEQYLGSLDHEQGVDERAYEILGDPIRNQLVDDGEGGTDLVPVYDPGRERLARTFRSVAVGAATPIDTHLDEYRTNKLRVKRRTEGDLVRGLERLKDWCLANGLKDNVSIIGSRQAIAFAEALANEQRLAPRTIKKYVSRLSLYWGYIKYKSYVPENPWLQVEVSVEKGKPGQVERAFTNKEVANLLMGPATPELRDVMMVGALSGARLDAIVDLKVSDTDHGFFRFKPQKSEEHFRYVPIHTDLAAIIARRREGRAPDVDLFPEYPRPKSLESERERSFKTSNHFTEYRRSVGVDERVNGKRRSLVNFHSFRRWFATRAEQAGIDESLVAAVVGHKRGSITLDLYSQGPEIEAARRCVQAVRLPPLDGSPITEPMLVLAGRGSRTLIDEHLANVQ
jgi:integrase